jgi:hypothetical protein
VFHELADTPLFRDYGGDPWISLRKLLIVLKNNPRLNSTIIFGGDSLMADTFMAFVCTMLSNGYDVPHLTEENGTLRAVHFYNESAWANLRLVRHSNDSELSPIVDVAFHLLEPIYFGEAYLSSKFECGLVLYNWAVHCPSVLCLTNYLMEIAPFLIAMQNSGFTILWKEHEAQHFSNADKSGLYSINNTKNCSVVQNYDIGNWRNAVAKLFLHEHRVARDPFQYRWNSTVHVPGLEKLAYIPIVPYFHYTMDWHWMKLPFFDCTHYCYVPGRFTVLWENLYHVLDKHMRMDSDAH